MAIAATNQAAADAGRAMAEAGGNAVDAAIAASLVTMVNEVGIVSLSSGGFITVQPPTGPAQTVDGWMDMPGRGPGGGSGRRAETSTGGGLGGGSGRRAETNTAPRAESNTATWDVHTDYGGGVTVTIGPGSVATHGAVAAFAETHRRWGSLPWAELFEPAIDEALRGFRLSGASRFYLDFVHEDIFGWDPVSHGLLHDADGAVTRELIYLPELADTLRAIAADPAQLYTGDVARAVADAVTAGGGLLSMADLAAYEPVVRDSLVAPVGDWTLATNPPPAVGGACVAAMLSLLAEHGIEDRDHMIAVQRRVLGERLRVFDHSDDLERDAAAFLDLIDREGLAVLESGSTAHISTSDGDGLSVALTVSSGYGSGLVAPGTGIWLNNCLGEMELNPRGLHGLAPGTRLLSNMAPTVGRHVDGSTLAIGSPGADRITTAIVQVLAGFVNSGLALADAVSHPRVHVHLAGRVDEEIKVEDQFSMYFGGVGATFHGADGTMDAAADPRRDGGTWLSGARGSVGA